MLGRNAVTLTNPVNAPVKTRSPSHLRRRQAPARGAEALSMESPTTLGLTRVLGDEDDVAPPEVEVLLLRAAREGLLVAEGYPLHARPVLAENDDLPAGGEVGEPLRQRDGIQDRGAALQLVAPRLPDLAEHGHLEAVDLADDHGDLGGGHVVGELPREGIPELRRGEAGRLDVLHQRERDLSVRPHRDGPA